MSLSRTEILRACILGFVLGALFLAIAWPY